MYYSSSRQVLCPCYFWIHCPFCKPLFQTVANSQYKNWHYARWIHCNFVLIYISNIRHNKSTLSLYLSVYNKLNYPQSWIFSTRFYILFKLELLTSLYLLFVYPHVWIQPCIVPFLTWHVQNLNIVQAVGSQHVYGFCISFNFDTPHSGGEKVICSSITTLKKNSSDNNFIYYLFINARNCPFLWRNIIWHI